MVQKILDTASGQVSMDLRYATGEAEVYQAQYLDTKTWPDGYKRYADLFRHDPKSLIVAVNNQGAVMSHMGVERIHDYEIGPDMPGWDHDPKVVFRPDGNVWYIVGHVVGPEYRKSGLAYEVVGYTIEEARANPEIDMLAVILRENHPTLGKASKFWEKFGLKPLEHTRNAGWKASPEAPDSGGIVYAIDTV